MNVPFLELIRVCFSLICSKSANLKFLIHIKGFKAHLATRPSLSVDRIYLHSAATVTRQGVVCPLTSQLTCCIASSTIIACIPYYSILLDFAFTSSGTLDAYITLWFQSVLQYSFIIVEYSVQCYRGAAESPVVTQVDYLWPPATSMSLFHGWQKECQSSSSSGDLWPAAALSAQDPHSWVSDVVSL